VIVLSWISPFPSLSLMFSRTVSPSFRAESSSSQVCFITVSKYFASDLLRAPWLSRIMYKALLKSLEKSMVKFLYHPPHFSSHFGSLNEVMNRPISMVVGSSFGTTAGSVFSAISDSVGFFGSVATVAFNAFFSCIALSKIPEFTVMEVFPVSASVSIAPEFSLFFTSAST